MGNFRWSCVHCHLKSALLSQLRRMQFSNSNCILIVRRYLALGMEFRHLPRAATAYHEVVLTMV